MLDQLIEQSIDEVNLISLGPNLGPNMGPANNVSHVRYGNQTLNQNERAALDHIV